MTEKRKTIKSKRKTIKSKRKTIKSKRKTKKNKCIYNDEGIRIKKLIKDIKIANNKKNKKNFKQLEI
jgi:hypothetical protein